MAVAHVGTTLLAPVPGSTEPGDLILLDRGATSRPSLTAKASRSRGWDRKRRRIGCPSRARRSGSRLWGTIRTDPGGMSRLMRQDCGLDRPS
jgi:hypothetical protein